MVLLGSPLFLGTSPQSFLSRLESAVIITESFLYEQVDKHNIHSRNGWHFVNFFDSKNESLKVATFIPIMFDNPL